MKSPNKVKVRRRLTSERTYSLHLDYCVNGKRNRESLDLKIFEPPKSAQERSHNKESLIKAEYLRNERENQFFKDEIDEEVSLKRRRQIDFYDYLKEYLSDYSLKDKRMIKATLRAFASYAPPPLSSKEITEELCIGFKQYLNRNYKGETPSSYFARFKKIIRHAYKSKFLRTNPVEDIRNFKTEDSIVKDTLTPDEIRLLAQTDCHNKMVKRAFLFACNTGLRYVDIASLKWSEVKGDILRIDQEKTDKVVEIPLNLNAKMYLPEKPEKPGKNDLVFILPSENGTSKSLQKWVSGSGINKHITFHCARHTFGTLLAEQDCDVAVISKLLGHTSLKHTMKYVRVSSERKKKAVNLLPNIE